LTYGISLEQFNSLFEAQKGCCAICGKPQTEMKRRMHVDHDHATNVIRGLLCHMCNMGLGSFSDDVTKMTSAIAYLNKANAMLPEERLMPLFKSKQKKKRSRNKKKETAAFKIIRDAAPALASQLSEAP
jgi:Recombination endonuclease VII